MAYQVVDLECPGCGEDIAIDEEMMETRIVICPSCGQKYALSCDDDCDCDCCEDDDCDCGCGNHE